MVVGEMPERADVVIVGAGPGGYHAALEAAAAGRSVILVDRDGDAGVGGVCLREGCIPSKALLQLAAAARGADLRSEMGLPAHDGSVDFARFRAWKDGIVTRLGDAVRDRLRRAGVEVVAGTARLRDARTMRVETPEGPSFLYEFDAAILATGSRAIELPALSGDPRVIHASGVFELDELPERAAIVGGGYIGVELGTALAKLGVRVTIVEAGARILPTFDASAASDVATGLRKLGVELRTGAAVTGLGDRGLMLGDEAITADLVISAVGRRPASDSLGLDAAGIVPLPSGHVPTDARRLATPRIAAIGDLAPGPGLAHKATADAEAAVAALVGNPHPGEQQIPLVIFSDPEVAAVGLDRHSAEELGYRVEERVTPVAAAGKSWILGETTGRHRRIVDADSGLLLGAVLTGTHATELIGEYALALEAGLLADDLALTIHPHPTLSELATLSFAP